MVLTFDGPTGEFPVDHFSSLVRFSSDGGLARVIDHINSPVNGQGLRGAHISITTEGLSGFDFQILPLTVAVSGDGTPQPFTLEVWFDELLLETRQRVLGTREESSADWTRLELQSDVIFLVDNFEVIPEPTAGSLIPIGLVLLALVRRRK